MMWISLVVIVFVAVGMVFLMWKVNRTRTLSAGSVSRIQSMIAKTNRMQDPVMRILDYDKILDQLLYELGFQGNTADKLKKGGARFKNIQTLWSYHKLRNTIAHEHGATASTRDADGFRDAIVQAVRYVS